MAVTVVPFQPERFLHAAIGDVHGDLPALVAAVDAVRAKAAESGRGAFLFVLGDAVDRGPDSAGCAAFLMRLARGEDPARKDARLVFVRGDHDLALSRDPATGTFSSLVEPGDWADGLNALPEDHPDRAVARAWIDFVREAPAAVLLRGEGEGVLLAHGAVPHADLLPRLQTLDDVGAPDCDRDFAWCRLSSAPRKIPNRASLFCDVGLDDLADFLDRLAELAGPVGHFVHGHEHAEEGCVATPVRGGRTAWTVTSFRGEGFFRPIRHAVLLLDSHAEAAEFDSHAEAAEFDSHAEAAEFAELFSSGPCPAGFRAAEPRDPADAGSAPARTRGATILAKPLYLEDPA